LERRFPNRPGPADADSFLTAENSKSVKSFNHEIHEIHLPKKFSRSFPLIQRRQGVHDFNRLHAHADDALEEVEDVLLGFEPLALADAQPALKSAISVTCRDGHEHGG
jgi:hypothetical protein